MNKVAICSIASKNFLAHTRTLFKSIREFHTDMDLYFLLADEIEGEFEKAQEIFNITEAKELGIPEFQSMVFKYDIVELNVALKPFFIRHLISKGYEKVIYFDSDIMVFNPLNYIIEILDKYSIIITPHITIPLSSDASFNFRERGFLNDGTYNLGFIAVSKKNETCEFLDWWASKCATECYRETETGLFVDQKWIDLIPGLYESVLILRNKGYNMGYWNLHERILVDLMVNGEDQLIFYHFSGINIDNINEISKYQDSYSLNNRPDLVKIFNLYKESVLSNCHEHTKDWIYKYGYYDNNIKVGLIARRLYSLVSDNYSDPFSTHPESFYYILKKKRLLEREYVIKLSRKQVESKAKPINKILKLVVRLLGIDRYSALMRYMRYISVIRRQQFLLDE